MPIHPITRKLRQIITSREAFDRYVRRVVELGGTRFKAIESLRNIGIIRRRLTQ
jgi:hypothetical protein